MRVRFVYSCRRPGPLPAVLLDFSGAPEPLKAPPLELVSRPGFLEVRVYGGRGQLPEFRDDPAGYAALVLSRAARCAELLGLRDYALLLCLALDAVKGGSAEYAVDRC